jgi:hypothetical protein
MERGSTESRARASGTVPSKETGRRRPSPDRTLVLAVVGLIVVVVAFFSSYASALGKPTAHHLPVAVTAPPAVVARLGASPLLRVHSVANLSNARRMVEDRAVYGALALPAAGPTTLLVANGGGHAVETILLQLGQQIAHARGTPLATVDVAPTSSQDPSGTVEFYCTVFLFLGAALGATVLGRILGPIRRFPDALWRLGWVSLYSGLLSVIVTFFADVVFGALVGHFGLLFLTLWLFVAAVCLAVTGLAARAGAAVSLVLILVLIALGNPSSGGPVPRPLLNSFYSGLNPVLPQGAALSALRGVEYFGNQGITPGLLCLLTWALAGLGLLAAAGLSWPHRRAGTGS